MKAARSDPPAKPRGSLRAPMPSKAVTVVEPRDPRTGRGGVMCVVKSFRYKDKLVLICFDEDPMDPRKEWDNAGIFWAWHRSYTIGDEDEVTRHDQTFCKSDFDPSNFNNFGELADAIYAKHRAVLVLPVYMLDHSGLSLSVGDFRDRWDSGQLGVIWLPREGLADIGHKIASKGAIAKAEDLLKAEIAVANAYVSGDVYGWQTFELVDGTKGKRLDSCWGYYGSDEIPYMLECALGSAEAAKAAEELSKHDTQNLLSGALRVA